MMSKASLITQLTLSGSSRKRERRSVENPEEYIGALKRVVYTRTAAISLNIAEQERIKYKKMVWSSVYTQE